MNVDTELLKEFEFYKSQSEEWHIQNKGKFVLIRNQEIHGIYENYTDALQEGIKNFGTEKFLIHEAGSENIINYTTLSLLGII